MRLVFMGSAEFSVPSLLALRMGYDIVGVVTQPDRPAGRGRKISANPVKNAALDAGIPVFQPESLAEPAARGQLADVEPDLVVVAAFGQILRPEILSLPAGGCINVHASLLPRWRGASPIAAAILAGDDETGITIMKMDPGMDTGPILAQQETRIEVDDTTASLGARLAELGAQLLVEKLPDYLEDELFPVPQPETGITMAPQIVKRDGRIEWTRPADLIDRQIRAYTPWPGAFTTWNGKRLKIVEAIPLPDWVGSEPAGKVVADEVCPLVVTGDGALWLTRIQLEGKKAMASDAFVRGQPGFVGAELI